MVLYLLNLDEDSFIAESLCLLDTMELSGLAKEFINKIGDFLCKETFLPMRRKKLRHVINSIKQLLQLRSNHQIRDLVIIHNEDKIFIDHLEGVNKAVLSNILLLMLSETILALRMRILDKSRDFTPYYQLVAQQLNNLRHRLLIFDVDRNPVKRLKLHFSCNEINLNPVKTVTTFRGPFKGEVARRSISGQP